MILLHYIYYMILDIENELVEAPYRLRAKEMITKPLILNFDAQRLKRRMACR